MGSFYRQSRRLFVRSIAVFLILADVVEVKTGSWSTAHWSNGFIRLNGLRAVAQLLGVKRDDDIAAVGAPASGARHSVVGSSGV